MCKQAESAQARLAFEAPGDAKPRFEVALDLLTRLGRPINAATASDVFVEMAVATKDLDTPVGLIPAGTVAAQRFTWQGVAGGEPRVTARVNWLMGEDLDPAWKLGGERFEVSFDADPPLHVIFHGLHPPVVGEDLERNRGLMATANNCVNSIPYVCEAEPGVKTYLDLPMIAGRAT